MSSNLGPRVDCRVEAGDPKGNPIVLSGRIPARICEALKRFRRAGILVLGEEGAIVFLGRDGGDVKALSTLVLVGMKTVLAQFEKGKAYKAQ